MASDVKKMSVLQLTVLTAINMMGSGIVMLPSKLAQVGTISILSWVVTALGSLALAYAFSQCGRFSRKPGGMGGYAEYAFGRSGNFMANYTYWGIVADREHRHLGHRCRLRRCAFGWSLTPIEVGIATIALLWLTMVANFGGAQTTGRIGSITVWG